jgi:hypothetical protein
MSAEPSVSSRGLRLLDRANRLLSEANSLEDLKEARDTAEAARTFAKAARLGLELQNRAAELKLRAERKAGTFLAHLRLRGGDRRSKCQDVTLKLEQLGVTKRQSSLWQLAATVPDESFEGYLRDKNALGHEVTGSGLLRIAHAMRRSSPPRRRRWRNARCTRRAESTPEDRAEVSAVIGDLKNQVQHLAKLLEPLAAVGDVAYRPAERRFISRLAQDIQRAVLELEDQMTRR